MSETKPKPLTGRDLGRAICSHFGIDYHKHTVDSNFEIKAGSGKMVEVKLTFMLTADDLAGIAKAAGECDTAVGDTAAAEKPQASGDKYGGAVMHSSPYTVSTVLLSDVAADTLRKYGIQAAAPGQLLHAELDPRLDEIIALLKQLIEGQRKASYERAKTLWPYQ